MDKLPISRLFTEPAIHLPEKTYPMEELLRHVRGDPTLSPDERRLLEGRIRDDRFMSKFLKNAAGGAMGYTLARFFKMGRKGQILMTLAGFGLGKLLLAGMGEKGEGLKHSVYDKKTRTYLIERQ